VSHDFLVSGLFASANSNKTILNHLINTFQYAYIKCQSTETTQLAVRDHKLLIRLWVSRRSPISVFLIFLLSFIIMITRTILFHRLPSWFHRTGNALSSIKSYLTSRSLDVNFKMLFISSFKFYLLFFRTLSLVFCFLFSVLFFPVLSCLILLSVSTSMLVQHNFTFHL
jgi:hypothetical protein